MKKNHNTYYERTNPIETCTKGRSKHLMKLLYLFAICCIIFLQIAASAFIQKNAGEDQNWYGPLRTSRIWLNETTFQRIFLNLTYDEKRRKENCSSLILHLSLSLLYAIWNERNLKTVRRLFPRSEKIDLQTARFGPQYFYQAKWDLKEIGVGMIRKRYCLISARRTHILQKCWAIWPRQERPRRTIMARWSAQKPFPTSLATQPSALLADCCAVRYRPLEPSKSELDVLISM